MKKYAIIVAAGSGSRMQTDIPKQFLLLQNKPVYAHAVECFLNTFIDIEIILVTPLHYDYGEEKVYSYFPSNKHHIKVIKGGYTRTESVINALNHITDNGIVFIHDAVRPFINSTFLTRLYNTALEKGNAIPSIAVNDSIRQLDGEQNIALNRNNLRAIQTPQVFTIQSIKNAYRLITSNDISDDATVLENAGEKVYLCEGLIGNFKITTPLDMEIAKHVNMV